MSPLAVVRLRGVRHTISIDTAVMLHELIFPHTMDGKREIEEKRDRWNWRRKEDDLEADMDMRRRWKCRWTHTLISTSARPW